jgi:hypothetical protein
MCFLPLARSLVTLATMVGVGLFHRRAKGNWPTINEWNEFTGSYPSTASIVKKGIELLRTTRFRSRASSAAKNAKTRGYLLDSK